MRHAYFDIDGAPGKLPLCSGLAERIGPPLDDTPEEPEPVLVRGPFGECEAPELADPRPIRAEDFEDVECPDCAASLKNEAATRYWLI